MTPSRFAELRTLEISADMGVHAPRTCRDIFREACAVERPAPDGHRWIVPACAVAALALFVLIAIERLQ
jgi:hypothetical protein